MKAADRTTWLQRRIRRPRDLGKRGMKMKSRTLVFKAAGINRPVLLGFALLSTSLMLLIDFDLEVRAQSPATIPVFTGMGEPLPGVAHNPADLAIFSNGQLNFKEVE